MKTIPASQPTQSQPAITQAVDFSTLTVVIPAYNEADGICNTLQDLQAQPELASAEIVVVDDASTDATAEIVRGFPGVRLIQHSHNKGNSGAIATGVRSAHCKYVCFFDADYQHRAEDLVRVAAALISNEWDYCFGVRGAQSYEEPSRRFGKWILRQAVRFVAGRPVQDFNCGLRGFKREVIQRYLHLLPRGFGVTTTTLLMLERGYLGGEVPVVVRKRVGKSTVRQMRDGFRTLLLLLRILLLFKPLQFFGGVGALLVLVGGVYGFWKAFTLNQGFPTLGALVVILGIQSFFFGLLADQVSALRRERFE